MEIMKIKSLFFGALLCASFSACSDDVIDNGQSQKGELENIPAYITVSLTPGSSSSRAEVNGDGHGDAEDSGHHNAGTVAENTVTDLLVIIKSVDGNGNNATNSGVIKHITNSEETVGTGGSEESPILTIMEKFKVMAGQHKVLVIVNPTTAIETAATTASESGYTAIGTLYDDLLAGKLVGDSYGEATAIQTANQFMMVNNAEVTVNATTENSMNSPAEASILVERVTSKITFREKTVEGENEANVYPITFNLTHYGYKVITSGSDTYALAKDATGITDVLVKGTITEDNLVSGTTDVYNSFTASLVDGKPQVYAYGDGGTVGTLLSPYQLKTSESIPGDVYYYPNDKTEAWIPEYVMQPYYETVDTWRVKLTKYALVNLNKDVYVVRHTADALGQNIKPFGFLNGQNYIADANFEAKNNNAANLANTEWLKTNWNAGMYGEWFNNPLAAVAAETAGTVTNPSFFNDLPGTDDDMPNDYEDNTHTSASTPNNPGTMLGYCLETTTMAQNQKHGLTTGIVFESEIIAPEQNTEIILYQYDKKVFNKWEDIVKGYGPGNDKIADLTTALKGVTEQAVIDAALIAAGVKIYRNGKCYYHSSQIKHFDNGDNNVAGNMEFAIVRNNIYSLAVSDIKNIGDASIDPNPDTDDESPVGYIEVNARILPWIVRYQDIEF